jgi:hypothetical protein
MWFLMKKKALVAINLLAVISCIGIGFQVIMMPLIAKTAFKDDYQTLMFKCDNVMRDHLIAKNRVVYERSERSIKMLESAELGLMSCHDYDKLRKKMKMWGVTDNELSYIGLEAIEKNSDDLMQYVKIHEFKH